MHRGPLSRRRNMIDAAIGSGTSANRRAIKASVAGLEKGVVRRKTFTERSQFHHNGELSGGIDAIERVRPEHSSVKSNPDQRLVWSGCDDARNSVVIRKVERVNYRS